MNKEILIKLQADEKIEMDIISYYQQIADLAKGIKLPAEKLKDFSEGLETLYTDSERHYQEIVRLISKYQ